MKLFFILTAFSALSYGAAGLENQINEPIMNEQLDITASSTQRAPTTAADRLRVMRAKLEKRNEINTKFNEQKSDFSKTKLTTKPNKLTNTVSFKCVLAVSSSDNWLPDILGKTHEIEAVCIVLSWFSTEIPIE